MATAKRRGRARASGSARVRRAQTGSDEEPVLKAGAKKTVKLTRLAGAPPGDKRPARPAPRLRPAAARVARTGRSSAARVEGADRFAPLSEGEVAAALRVVTSDSHLAGMAQVGRYRVVAAEPLPVKRAHPRADHRLARVVIFDYASERSLDASVDLDREEMWELTASRLQPGLARSEEEEATAIAMADERVRGELSLGDEPQVALHYWSHGPSGRGAGQAGRSTDLARTRRSAAVLFGQPGARPSVVAVVDLMEESVIEVAAGSRW